MKKNIDLNQLRFPIGEYYFPEDKIKSNFNKWLKIIEVLPRKVSQLTESLSKEELGWNYREGGWSIRQVVHHLADSHINAFIRFKLALTEVEPSIKPYFEDRWAEMEDYRVEIWPSIHILKGVHHRWVKLLAQVTDEELLRKFYHPEHNQFVTLNEQVGNYAWHGEHHLAHIRQAIKYKGIFN